MEATAKKATPKKTKVKYPQVFQKQLTANKHLETCIEDLGNGTFKIKCIKLETGKNTYVPITTAIHPKSMGDAGLILADPKAEAQREKIKTKVDPKVIAEQREKAELKAQIEELKKQLENKE